jgi:hypothetical protein
MIFLFGIVSPVIAVSPTGWSPVVLPTGVYRNQIKSMPIHQRPGRPMHVYGNTVRLMAHSDKVERVRPVRQIFFGTTDFRSDRSR